MIVENLLWASFLYNFVHLLSHYGCKPEGKQFAVKKLRYVVEKFVYKAIYRMRSD